ncbi:DUF6428 family protein [Capnocytophaga canis]|uniref:DUF6428 family protein n=1 Tax=Capnocytophaga canis TaxID=1848903 RepID=UPI001561C114|nr:DUF6428 family protein [Capnocytophaga canis]
MKLSQIKNILTSLESIYFQLENGTFVPPHFHITEIGLITRHFIDCGGTIRLEKVINFQLWSADDFNHQLKSSKFLKIIEISEEKLQLPDVKVEIEYQGETIGKYDLEFNKTHFILKNKNTNCLAQDQCGIPKNKTNIKLLELNKSCNSNPKCC